MLRVLFVIFCTIISLINFYYPLHFGYSETSNFYTHFTFMFVHLGSYHLIINLYVFYTLYEVLEKKLGSYALWLPLLVSFLASFLCEYKIPTIGLSGVIFSMLALFFVFYRLKRSNYILNAFILSIGLVVGYYSNVNIKLHIVCFLSSLVIGIAIKEVFRFRKLVDVL